MTTFELVLGIYVSLVLSIHAYVIFRLANALENLINSQCDKSKEKLMRMRSAGLSGDKLNQVRVDQRGSIYVPPSDVETAREKIIEENRAQGKDTPISELTDQ